MKKCRAAKLELAYQYKPAQFVHIGQFSSLEGKVQQLTDASNQQNPQLETWETHEGADKNALKTFYKTHRNPIVWPQTFETDKKDRFVQFTFKHLQAFGTIEITTGSPDQLPSETELWIMSEMEVWMKLGTIAQCSMSNKNSKNTEAPRTVTGRCPLKNIDSKSPIKIYKGLKLLVPQNFTNPINLLSIIIK